MRARRVLGELLALGLTNGALLGAALAAAHPTAALLVASGGGTFISFLYLLLMLWSH